MVDSRNRPVDVAFALSAEVEDSGLGGFERVTRSDLTILEIGWTSARTDGQSQENAGQAGLELVVVKPPMQNGGSG